MSSQHDYFLSEAIKEAQKALLTGDVPIGAVVVKNDQIIGRGYNRREADNDPTAHAEILALREAGKHLGTWRLSGCTLYVTMEPCPMCCGALINSRIETVVYGADEPKFGSAGSQLNLLQFPGFNHNVKIIGPLAQERCENLLRDFFVKLRNQTKDGYPPQTWQA